MKMEPKTSSVFRIVFLGGPGVGKTSIIQRCVYNEFKEKSSPTVEDMYFYKLNLPGKKASIVSFFLTVNLKYYYVS